MMRRPTHKSHVPPSLVSGAPLTHPEIRRSRRTLASRTNPEEQERIHRQETAFFTSCLASIATLLLVGLSARASLDGALYNVSLAAHMVAHGLALAASAGLCLRLFERQDSASKVSFALIGCALLLIIFQCSLPILSRDALIYHLEVARTWLNAGSVSEIGGNEWSYFPLLLSTAYAGLLKTGTDTLTAYYHATYLPLTAAVAAAVIFRLSRLRVLALGGFALCLTLPVCFRLATEPVADIGVAFFFGTGLWAMLRWEQEGRRRKFAILAGIAFGASLSTKYNPILALALFACTFVLHGVRRGIDPRRLLGHLLLAGGVATLIYSPWAVQNYAWTGNPVHPFLHEIFGSSGAPDTFKRITPIQYRTLIYGESFLDLLLVPLRMILAGKDGSARTFDGVLSPLLLLLFLPLVRCWQQRRTESWHRFAYLLVGSYFAFNFVLFDLVVRYQAPLLVAVLALTAEGIRILAWRRDGSRRPAVLTALLLAHGIFFAHYSIGLLQRSSTIEYISGGTSREEYLEEHLAGYPLVRFVNEKLPESARVYLLFSGNWYFYYRRPVVGAYYSADLLTRILHSGGDASALLHSLHERGIDHLAIHGPRLRSLLETDLSPEEMRVWSEFTQRGLRLLYQHREYSLSALRESLSPLASS